MVRNHAYVMMKLKQEQRKEFCLTKHSILCKDCYGFSIKMSLMDNECKALILSTKNLVFDLVSATTPSKGCGQTYQHDS